MTIKHIKGLVNDTADWHSRLDQIDASPDVLALAELLDDLHDSDSIVSPVWVQ